MAAFLKDVANMEFDGAFCNIECPSYLSVRHTPYDEREYLSFPCRKAESGNIFLKALSLQFLGACYRSIELLIKHEKERDQKYKNDARDNYERRTVEQLRAKRTRCFPEASE